MPFLGRARTTAPILGLTRNLRPQRGLKCAIWELTLACNLRCSHCGSSAGLARQKELSKDECINLCEQLAGMGCEVVALMGGEPFLREDCFQIASSARQLGMKVNFVSNGMVVDRFIKDIVRVDPQVVGISLDGMKENHESIRGDGTWDKAISALDMLGSNGVQTTVITTVSKVNFRDLPGLKDLILGKGANWQIQIAMPFGNFRRDLTLSREEFYATALFIAKQRLKNRFEDLPVVGAHCYGYFSRVLPGCSWAGCTAGMSTIGITSDGGIVGCLSMGNDRFLEGNIRQTPLKGIWDDPRSFAYNRDPAKMVLGPNCVRCPNGSKCGGGCNSVSQTMTGQFHNDPYCFYAIEKEHKMA